MSAILARQAGASRRLMGLLATSCVLAQLGGGFLPTGLALGVWLAVLGRVDGPALRRLWMPRFWGLSLALALASGALLGTRDVHLFGLGFSRTGLEAGALMLLRGAFVFSLAAWASRALRPEDIQRWAARVGAARLGVALPAALELLPALTDRLRADTGREARRRRGPWALAEGLVCHAAGLAQELTARFTRIEGSAGPLRVAVVGPQGSGKTSALRTLAAGLEAAGLRIGGVTQPVIHEGGRRVGYRLRDMARGEERPFAERRRARRPDELGFQFEPDGFAWAAERVRAARLAADVLVVDELSLVEVSGKGHLPALEEELPDERARLWLLGVRAECRAELERLLGPFELVLAPRAAPARLDELARLAGAPGPGKG